MSDESKILLGIPLTGSGGKGESEGEKAKSKKRSLILTAEGRRKPGESLHFRNFMEVPNVVFLSQLLMRDHWRVAKREEDQLRSLQFPQERDRACQILCNSGLGILRKETDLEKT